MTELPAGTILQPGDIRQSKSDTSHVEDIPESYYGKPVRQSVDTDYIYRRPDPASDENA